MKNISQYIKEGFADNYSVGNRNIIVATNETIDEIVKTEIEKLGWNADLNHIDVSRVTNMGAVFMYSGFNGDISKWDVSNVENMRSMFYDSKFNGDISKWDVSKVFVMSRMFEKSDFNGDISNWEFLDNKFLEFRVSNFCKGGKLLKNKDFIKNLAIKNIKHQLSDESYFLSKNRGIDKIPDKYGNTEYRTFICWLELLKDDTNKHLRHRVEKCMAKLFPKYNAYPPIELTNLQQIVSHYDLHTKQGSIGISPDDVEKILKLKH